GRSRPSPPAADHRRRRLRVHAAHPRGRADVAGLRRGRPGAQRRRGRGAVPPASARRPDAGSRHARPRRRRSAQGADRHARPHAADRGRLGALADAERPRAGGALGGRLRLPGQAGGPRRHEAVRGRAGAEGGPRRRLAPRRALDHGRRSGTRRAGEGRAPVLRRQAVRGDRVVDRWPAGARSADPPAALAAGQRRRDRPAHAARLHPVAGGPARRRLAAVGARGLRARRDRPGNPSPGTGRQSPAPRRRRPDLLLAGAAGQRAVPGRRSHDRRRGAAAPLPRPARRADGHGPGRPRGRARRQGGGRRGPRGGRGDLHRLRHAACRRGGGPRRRGPCARPTPRSDRPRGWSM
ncbi:MAG: Chemotaxis response regulator protein-glutamate methylesterase CheB, partial [uncultured Solirubrobacteraceae bacterium]